jgi:hypothetical protein
VSASVAAYALLLLWLWCESACVLWCASHGAAADTGIEKRHRATALRVCHEVIT